MTKFDLAINDRLTWQPNCTASEWRFLMSMLYFFDTAMALSFESPFSMYSRSARADQSLYTRALTHTRSFSARPLLSFGAMASLGRRPSRC